MTERHARREPSTGADATRSEHSTGGDAAGSAHSTGFGQWWREVGSSALLGTARRPVPPLPAFAGLVVSADPGARSEEALLTAAALGSTAVRAGRRPSRTSLPEAAPDDERPPAGRLASQLLELVITQPPAGAQQRNALLLHWLRTARATDRRVPHALLPAVLELATGSRELRIPTAHVVDRRGAWLAAQRADWAWVADASAGVESRPDVLPDDWALLPSTARVTLLGLLRSSDPGTARELVESTWRTDSAKDRAAHLDTLRIGLGPHDEPLLEQALDDRAATVRDVATSLLDGLPASARAERMAARLRPLIHAKGRLRRTLDVALPDEPDLAGRRDGLGRPAGRRSARGYWLERIAAGAPLEVWTEETGWDPATIVSQLSEGDALSGIRRAVRLRRDPVWAEAVLASVWDPALVPALPAGRREATVLARLGAADPAAIAGVIGSVPGPWSAAFSLAVLARLGAAKGAATHVAQAMPQLLAALHPDALPAVEAWLARVREDVRLATNLRNLLQFHSVKRSITEAFR